MYVWAILFAADIFFVFSAICGNAARTTTAALRARAAATASALMFYFGVYCARHSAHERRANNRKNNDFPPSHAVTSECFLFLRNLSLPLLFSTISVTAKAAAAIQTNEVHHQLPIVYTAAPTM